MGFKTASDVTKVTVSKHKWWAELEGRQGNIYIPINSSSVVEYNERWVNFCIRYFEARGVPIEFEK
jgi:hypothetical protein